MAIIRDGRHVYSLLYSWINAVLNVPVTLSLHSALSHRI